MSEPAVADPRSAYLVYADSCDLEDEILKPENVRAWADGFASKFSLHQDELVLRGVGDGGERLLGALSYLGTVQAEIACRSTDYTGRTVALVFTTAVSPVGLDRAAAQWGLDGHLLDPDTDQVIGQLGHRTRGRLDVPHLADAPPGPARVR